MKQVVSLVIVGLLILVYSSLVVVDQFRPFCPQTICPKLALGLDLRGGTHFTLKLIDEENRFGRLSENEKLKEIEATMDVLRSRVDSFGVAEASFLRISEDQIAVQIPGEQGRERVRNLITQTAKLDFKFVLDFEDAVPGLTENIRDRVTGDEYVVEKASMLSGADIEDVYLSVSEFGAPEVRFKLTGDGVRKFSELTSRKNQGRMFAVIVDGEMMSALSVGEQVTTEWVSVEYSGGGEQASSEAQDLVIILRSGSLKYDLDLVEERTVGATLGEDQIQRSLSAMLYALILVILFLVIVYRRNAVFSVTVLFFSLTSLISFLAALDGTLTLPGMAALILTAGMSVDASILVLERVKEGDMDWGKMSLPIIDANITTALAAVVLFHFGNGPIKGFGTVLLLGVVTTIAATFLILYPCLKLGLIRMDTPLKES